MDFLTLCYHISILDFVQMFFTQREILTALADDDDDDLETPTQHFLCFSPGLIISASRISSSAQCWQITITILSQTIFLSLHSTTLILSTQLKSCHNPSPSRSPKSKVQSLKSKVERTWSDSILLCHHHISACATPYLRLRPPT